MNPSSGPQIETKLREAVEAIQKAAAEAISALDALTPRSHEKRADAITTLTHSFGNQLREIAQQIDPEPRTFMLRLGRTLDEQRKPPQPGLQIWEYGRFVPWEEASMHPISNTAQYGTNVFEGIRFYMTPKGIAILELDKHVARLFYSAQEIGMSLGSSPAEIDLLKGDIRKTIIDTVAVNAAAAGISEGYIRPFFHYGPESRKLNPKGASVNFSCAVWDMGKYLGVDSVDVRISDVERLSPSAFNVHAKHGGAYVNSIRAVQDVAQYVDESGKPLYGEAVLLDYRGYVAEGPGENFFFVKDGELHTPTTKCILPGITREIIMAIAKSEGLVVRERDIDPTQAIEAEEAFFCGTAAEVTPIRSIDDVPIGNREVGKVTRRIKERFSAIVRGKDEAFEHLLTYVSPARVEIG